MLLSYLTKVSNWPNHLRYLVILPQTKLQHSRITCQDHNNPVRVFNQGHLQGPNPDPLPSYMSIFQLYLLIQNSFHLSIAWLGRATPRCQLWWAPKPTQTLLVQVDQKRLFKQLRYWLKYWKHLSSGGGYSLFQAVLPVKMPSNFLLIVTCNRLELNCCILLNKQVPTLQFQLTAACQLAGLTDAFLDSS